MCQIGVLPAMRLLTPNSYADAWRAMDSYLDRSMPPYKISLLLVTAGSVLVFAIQHRMVQATLCATSFVLSLTGLGLTMAKQLPLNSKLKDLPQPSPDAVLMDIREQTFRNFTVRFFLALASFIVLCVGATFWP